MRTVVVIVIIILALLLLLGRTFCGHLCPLGIVQNLLWKVTERLHLPKLHRHEGFVKVIRILNRVFLGLFLCGITALIVTVLFFPEVFRSVRIPAAVPVAAVSVIAVTGLFARRLFCNVCPIGSFLGIFHKISIFRLKKDGRACTMCGACYEACPMRIKSVYLESGRADVTKAQCILCGTCIGKCPEDGALTLTVCGRAVRSSSKEKFMEKQFAGIDTERKVRK